MAAALLMLVVVSIAGRAYGATPTEVTWQTNGTITATRWGKLKAGMTPPRVRAAWGQPSTAAARYGSLYFTYGLAAQSITISFVKYEGRWRLDSIGTRLPGFTAGGGRVGMRFKTLRALNLKVNCDFSQEYELAHGCFLGRRRSPFASKEVYFYGNAGGRVLNISWVSNFAS